MNAVELAITIATAVTVIGLAWGVAVLAEVGNVIVWGLS